MIYTDLMFLELQKHVGQANKRELLQMETLSCGLEGTATNTSKNLKWLFQKNTRTPY